MRIEKRQMESGRDFLLYGLSFLLLLEWLLPLPHVTDTGFIYVFVLVTAVFFFITFLQLPVVLSMLLKIFVIFYGLYLVFFEGRFFSLDWLGLIVIDIKGNIELMLTGGWHALTDMFRSFLFFVLLSIMSYLLFYWTVHARRILFFLIFTVIYVTVIDTFTIYDATFAIIRTFIIGFLLLGLVTMYRMIEQQPSYSAPKFLPVRLAVLLVIMIGAGGVLGLFSPKLEPQWGDPVPFVRAAVGMGESGIGDPVQRIGYGDNDERLGGGFLDDNTPVFYAASTKEHYWRGETKDFYTGRGWDTTTPLEKKESMLDISPSIATHEQLEVELAFTNESGGILFDHLFYPGELLVTDQIRNADLFQDAYTGKASTYNGTEAVQLSNYRYEYRYPSYQIEGLRLSSEQDPQVIQQYYTQLPDDLPERVTKLALEITGNADNRYDRAKAVELFFGLGDFQYETVDVPVPREGEDYVDQFLFETQRGYCDNFSTSMIVLLRTLDIPARWAKGFTQGEVIESLDDTRDVYQVTNGNAHSWVEVYFPEVGWVPFEPTRGFDNNVDFIEPEVEIEDAETAVEPGSENEPEVEDVFADLESDDESSTSSNGGASGNWTISGGPWILVAAVVGILLFVLLRNKRIVRYYTLTRFARRDDDKAFIQAYERLLWLLTYLGWKRQEGETLREYAERMDKQYSANEMMSLTVEYEKIMYGGQSMDSSWSNQKSNWITFVRKIDS
ncbi:transglutaminase TgpA family protein [Alkalihalobacillus deserti]|uniref:transglutaminase TgpA family protein n=1 Tax=Alkalihalobacillus deserti TaxID=2879466 RepID=UPI001D13ECD8|nr:transglutaminaseTgpA domain-containing protein [Alkalihalobacillus deserti]